jgi:nucleotide-binding universal stress UspA family protein
MRKILCATRGGEASYRTQDKVIEMAKTGGATLLFVFAVDMDFLGKTAAPILVDVENELENMAEFLLIMAQERAEKAGVEAEYVVRWGLLPDVLAEVATEQKVDLIVLGSPGEGENRFVMEGLEKFAASVHEASGTEVKIV